MVKRFLVSGRTGYYLERLVALDALPDDWRHYFAEQLASSTLTGRTSTSGRSTNAHAR